jgi:SAM-dependent methyltransferase
MTSDTEPAELFDAYASDYDATLEKGLAVSGEGKEYFARGRVAWLARMLRRMGRRPGRVMDYGCGTGSTAPLLHELLPAERVLGLDVSPDSIALAQRRHQTKGIDFATIAGQRFRDEFDLIYCNGVFHHIPLDQRAAAVASLHQALKPGGLFALWENNPWNPGTRYVMSRLPFDRDAIPLTARQTRRLLREGGFEVLGTSYLFIFPHLLRWLRWLERPLRRVPIGAQYQVLAQKRER